MKEGALRVARIGYSSYNCKYISIVLQLEGCFSLRAPQLCNVSKCNGIETCKRSRRLTHREGRSSQGRREKDRVHPSRVVS